MPMSSTSRYRLDPAPGMTLLQDLVNTRGVPAYDVPDLLALPADAQAWFVEVTAAWAAERGLAAPPASLGTAGHRRLLALRDAVDALLAGEREALPPADVRLGGNAPAPSGTGVAWLEGAVAIEALTADLRGELGRLKTCRNRHCPCAFYDRSRNNSRVWHDVHTCGNAANLRASRARRRTPPG
jgi:predicted RNA-binding Zn ribbon-like protein